jgi:lipid A 3-O-deacylase
MRNLVIRAAVALVLVGASAPSAQAQKWTGWSVHWENDSFVPPHLSSDRSYTNGVRFTLGRHPEESPKWVDAIRDEVRGWIPGRRDFQPSLGIVAGQNFFTPEVITTFAPDPTDRPFAGLLYGGVRIDVTEIAPVNERSLRAYARVQHSIEMVGGFLGPIALADQVQTGVHLLRQSRIPKGWERQLGTELALNGSYLGRVKLGWHFFDMIPHAGIALGTVQTFGNAGATARVGWNMSGFPALLNPLTVSPLALPTKWEVAFGAGVEGRYYFRNAYVDGGLLGGHPKVDGRRDISDYRLGAMVRICSWSFSYNYVHRSREFELPPGGGDGEHDFGSVSLNNDFGMNPCEPVDRNWLLTDWTFDVGIGGAISRHAGTGSEETRDGMSMRAGLTKGIVGPFALGAELVGAVREGNVADIAGFHRDAFLVTKAITLAWRPKLGPGTLIVRGGVGCALYKIEATRGLEHNAEREDTGTGWLAALGYDLPSNRTISLGVDVVWSHLGVASAAGPDASFLSTTFGFNWRP